MTMGREAAMGDESRRITRRDVIAVLDVNEDFLLELERESIVTTEGEGFYPEAELERIRLCRTLHDDLGVNFAGLEVALHLIEMIEKERGRFAEMLRSLSHELEPKSDES
jgi:signal transduction histidine kinase